MGRSSSSSKSFSYKERPMDGTVPDRWNIKNNSRTRSCNSDAKARHRQGFGNFAAAIASPTSALLFRAAPILPVGGARAFARNHRRTERMVRRAAGPKRLALIGTQKADQHLTAAAFQRLDRRRRGVRETAIRVQVV